MTPYSVVVEYCRLNCLSPTAANRGLAFARAVGGGNLTFTAATEWDLSSNHTQRLRDQGNSRRVKSKCISWGHQSPDSD